jgi:uncharacterized membrane protein (UPF0127 family)
MRILSALLIALLAACSQTAHKAENTAGPSARQTSLLPLVIRSAKGEHRFDVEVALNPGDQERGLMFRKSLAADSGMLFPMEPPRTASFWMKDTLIPLDMLFIHTDGTIAFIKAMTQPYSREPVSAGVPPCWNWPAGGRRNWGSGKATASAGVIAPCPEPARTKHGTGSISAPLPDRSRTSALPSSRPSG